MNNAKQVAPDWQSLSYDTTFMMRQMDRQERPENTILRQALLSHPRFVTIMIDLLSLLLEVKTSQLNDVQPKVTLVDLLRVPFLSLGRHFEIIGYDCSVQLAETTIIKLITRLAPTYSSDPTILTPIETLLLIALGGFIMHRPILSDVVWELVAADVDRFTKRQSHLRVGQSFLALSSSEAGGRAHWEKADRPSPRRSRSSYVPDRRRPAVVVRGSGSHLQIGEGDRQDIG